MSLLAKVCAHQGEAIVFDGRSIGYAQLLTQAQMLRDKWRAGRWLIFLEAQHHPDTIVIYLAALLGGHPLLLLNPKLDEASKAALVARYQPNLYLRHGLEDVSFIHQRHHPMDEELALLLTTSGSTGGVKLVQLSLANLSANAASICDYLGMSAQSRALSALPLAYSYGLSLLNSHLYCGGSLVLTEPDPLQRSFWQQLREQRVTQLAGVPYSYQIYEQLRLRRGNWPDLAVLTQAGGHLSSELARLYAQWAEQQGKQFYLMYGQTEATARIAYLPPEQLALRPDSIGIAIPGGELSLVDRAGQPSEHEGELVYRGANVMLGYGESLADLAAPARPTVLYSGDLARCDSQGYFYITGRLKRMIKLSGMRTSLDALEQTLHQQGLPCVCTGRDDLLQLAISDASLAEPLNAYLREQMALHPSRFQISYLERLPYSANGKLDYPELARQIARDYERL